MSYIHFRASIARAIVKMSIFFWHCAMIGDIFFNLNESMYMKKSTKALCMSLLLCPALYLNAGNGMSGIRHNARAGQALRAPDPDEFLRKKMSEDATVNTIDSNGYTILHHAVREGNLDLIMTYVERGAAVNAVDAKGYSPLYYSIASGNEEKVDLFLDAGAQELEGKNLVETAIDVDKRTVALLLLNRGMRANDHALQKMVVGQNYLSLLRVALNQGGYNIDVQEAVGGNTLLMLSIVGKHPNEKVFGELLSRGARGDIANKQGALPIHLAVTKGLMYTIKLLLKQNPAYACAACQWQDGERVESIYPLHFYAQSKYATDAVADALIAAGASVEGSTAPIHAVAHGHSAAFKKLIALGCDPDIADYDGKTALMVALCHGDNDIATQLMSNPEVKKTVATGGSTLLHFAAEGGLVNQIEAIQEKYALNINAIDDKGNTPLQVAQITGKYAAARKLRQLAALELSNEKEEAPSDITEWMLIDGNEGSDGKSE